MKQIKYFCDRCHKEISSEEARRNSDASRIVENAVTNVLSNEMLYLCDDCACEVLAMKERFDEEVKSFYYEKKNKKGDI